MKKYIFTFIGVVSLLILSACSEKSPSGEQVSVNGAGVYTEPADTTLDTTEVTLTTDDTSETAASSEATDETAVSSEATDETAAGSEVTSKAAVTSETASKTTVTSEKATVTAEPAPEITAAAVSAAKPVTSNDMRLNIGGAAFSLRGGIEAVFSNLGKNYQYAESISCDHDGMDKTFVYSTAEFYTWPMPNGDLICEIYSNSQSASTSRGVSVGASKEAVLSAYGNNGVITDSQIVYKIPNSNNPSGSDTLYFEVQSGVVTAVCVTALPV